MVDISGPGALGSRARSESGTVLLLFPVAVLVVVILASLAVDRAVAFGAQRDLVATAEAAANDGAAAGVAVDSIRDGEGIVYDTARIDRAVRSATERADGNVRVRWRVEGSDLVVEMSQEVRLIFAPGVVGAKDRVTVTATARADLTTTS